MNLTQVLGISPERGEVLDQIGADICARTLMGGDNFSMVKEIADNFTDAKEVAYVTYLCAMSVNEVKQNPLALLAGLLSE